MGKEIKIGLGIIGALLCVFGGVLFMRLKREQPLMADAKATLEKVEAKLKPKKASKPDKEEKPKNRKVSFDAALAKAAGPSRLKKPARAALDRYGRPNDEEPQVAAEDARYEPANRDEAPTVEQSPYRNRPRDDRYSPQPAEPEPRDPDKEAIADDAKQAEETNEDVAIPADRFSPAGVGLALTPPGEDVEEPAADQGAAESIDPADERLADDEPPTRYNDEQGMFPGRSAAEEALADNADAPASGADEAAADEPAEVPPQAAEGDGYTVEPNDNFWRISQKVYGTGAYFKALEEYNRRQYGDQVAIHAGDVISAPPLEVLRKQYPDLAPKGPIAPAARRPARGRRSYTVGEGETLFDIARHELGKASRWSEIYELNRDQLGNDFNDLTPGMKLALPDDGGQRDPLMGGSPPDGYRR